VKELSCEVAVIGGGINGLCALTHLHRMGVPNLLLLEQFRVGHDRGSSHGKSRITRSAYVDRAYVKLMQIAHAQEWPRLEQDLGVQLIYKTTGCFYGTEASGFGRYRDSVAGMGLDLEVLTPDEARTRFPLFNFPDADGVVVDHTAGVVAAERTIVNLDRHLARSGVSRLENAGVLEIDPTEDPILIRTNHVNVRAKRLVVTAGSWTNRLVPALNPRLSVARQTVGYVRLKGDPSEFTPGAFPVWGSFETTPRKTHYGLPQFERDGIKLALHRTNRAGDDPDADPGPPDEAIEELRTFIAEHFTRPIDSFIATESCLYTNTATEDYVLDLHPDNSAIAVGAGFSGHGFKLAPISGRILAELAMNGKTDIPEFESERNRFSIAGSAA